MVTISANETEGLLASLLAKVEREHEEVVICRDGKPVARLVGMKTARPDPFQQHPELRGVKVHEDPCAPLDKEDLPEDLR